MALVNGGFLHYTGMKKFSRNLLRKRLSDFEIISQESGLELADVRLPDSSRNCYGQATFTICEPAGQVTFSVRYSQFGSLSPIPVVFGL